MIQANELRIKKQTNRPLVETSCFGMVYENQPIVFSQAVKKQHFYDSMGFYWDIVATWTVVPHYLKSPTH